MLRRFVPLATAVVLGTAPWSPAPVAASELPATGVATPASAPADPVPVPVQASGAGPRVCADVVARRFADVRGGTHAANIACLGGLGIAQGGADGNFHPGGNVRRDQMASFLARTLEASGAPLPEQPRSVWSDVTSGPHARPVDQLTALGVIQGNSRGVFDPAGRVTRAQMATMLVRAAEVANGERFATASASGFTDTRGSVHAGSIDLAHGLGIASGVTATRFAPADAVRRDQMATFLVRTLEVVQAPCPAI
ncbi:S-layer homology domain-containing protein [Egicoccus halophilus]|uniref:SLH domain-containing protein n=1 Tax=Egicoccus halophilus TaxID=1670830 RepID=A0A8J3EUW2_9ACTN|nr:S-layer homology domain-containing protein [Egicoccus halophilus]GGI07992.1 hypothetical protein GCM10011354_26850 [Egicoccus halophilus]